MEMKPCEQSEIGVIPKDWEVCSLLSLASTKPNSVVGGPFGSDLTSKDYVPVGIPVIRGQNMSTRLVSGDFVYISPEKGKALQANMAKPGDLIFTQRGSLGQVSLVPEGIYPKYLVSQSQMKITLDGQRVVNAYILHYFQGTAGQKQIKDSAIQTGVPHTNLGILKAYLVPLPSTPNEQRAIAEALSDADTFIESLEQYVAKKRQIKHGAMQGLLTGRKRLHGFERQHGHQQTDIGLIPIDWDATPVGAKGEVRAGKALAARGPGRLRPYLRTKNVFDGRIDLNDVLEMPMTDADFARYSLRYGDILLNEGQSIELVGRCAMYKDEFQGPCAIQNQLVRFRARDSVSASFCAHLFRYCQLTGVFAKIALQTTSVAHLGVSRFARLMLAWPHDAGEQEAIAATLDDMDAEIAELESKLAKARQLKQGMMQELLTGRIRLV